MRYNCVTLRMECDKILLQDGEMQVGYYVQDFTWKVCNVAGTEYRVWRIASTLPYSDEILT